MRHTHKALFYTLLLGYFAFFSEFSNAQVQDKLREKVEEANPAKPKEEKKDNPNGTKADGTKADGTKADGTKADGTKADGTKTDLNPQGDKDKPKADNNGQAPLTKDGEKVILEGGGSPNTMGNIGMAGTKDKDKEVKIEDNVRGIDTTRFKERSMVKKRDQTQYKEGLQLITQKNSDAHKYSLNKDKYIFGWHPHWAGEAYKSYNFSLLNVLAYYSYEVDPSTGNYKSIGDWFDTDVVRYAHKQNKACKVLLSISSLGVAANEVFLKNGDAQSNLVRKVVKLISEKKADGIHLDFEGIPSSQRDAFTNFVIDLVAKLRGEMKGAFVSMSLPPVDFEQAYDVKQLGKHINLFVINGYEFYGANSDIAGPVSQIKGGGNWWNYNLERSVDEYIAAGIESHKLLLGLAYYGAEWVTADLKTPSKVRKFVKYLTYRDIKKIIGFATPSEDAESMSNYYVYKDNNNNYRQIWYDDSLSLSKKYDWVIEKKLGGVGIWALGYDNGHPQLWQALGAKFGGGVKAVKKKAIVTPGFLGKLVNPIVRLITNPQSALRGPGTFIAAFVLLLGGAGASFYAIYRYSCYFSQIFNLILRGSLTAFLMLLVFVIVAAYNYVETNTMTLFLVGFLVGAIIFLLLVRNFITEKQMP